MTRRLEIDAAKMARIRAMHADGYTYPAIAQATGISRTSIARLITGRRSPPLLKEEAQRMSEIECCERHLKVLRQNMPPPASINDFGPQLGMRVRLAERWRIGL